MVRVRLPRRLESRLLRLEHARLKALERRVHSLTLAAIGLRCLRSKLFARRLLRARGQCGKLDRIDPARFVAALFQREASLRRGPAQRVSQGGIFRAGSLLIELATAPRLDGALRRPRLDRLLLRLWLACAELRRGRRTGGLGELAC